MAKAPMSLFTSVLAIALGMALSCGTCPSFPSISSISPSSKTAGSSQFLFTVNGDNFQHDSLVSWNASFVVTTFVSTHQVLAVIPAKDIVQPGTVSVFVFNPAEGGTTFVPDGIGVVSTTSCSGKTSNFVSFTVSPSEAEPAE